MLNFYQQQIFENFIYHESLLHQGEVLENLFSTHQETTREIIFHYTVSGHNKFCKKLLELACEASEERKIPHYVVFYKQMIELNKRFGEANLNGLDAEDIFVNLDNEITNKI